MLEESRMDKKSQNRLSPQARASAIDCKKSAESSHKPWPRNNKKREGPANTPKNDQFRKNVPVQRGRGQVDRRPRARVGPTNFTLGGTQNSGVEDDEEPEIGSVFVPGSKKQNLNHLLNFMYPSRGTQDRGISRGYLPQRQAQQRIPRRLDHDLYLRANCQFVLKENGDYKSSLLDPDVPVKWEQIEEIVVRSTGRSECPICLGTPAAGRVSHCGHVYCWACVLHYAATNDKQPPPCPVCTTPLQVMDMKPTRQVQWDSPAEEVSMRLVRRLRGSTTVELAPSRGHHSEAVASAVLPINSMAATPYTKYFSANNYQVREIINRERKELQDQILAEIDTSELVYLEQALKLLEAKEAKMQTAYEQPKSFEEPESVVPIVYEKQVEKSEIKIDWFDIPDETARIDTIQEQVEDLAIGIAESCLNPDAPSFVQASENEIEEFPLAECSAIEIEEIVTEDDEIFTDIDKQNQSKYFYFYQAEDGQQVFLNSLNVRILNASWGGLVAAPLQLRGRVLQRETLSLTDQMRKHMPYTAHLPLYCAFDIVELDLQPPYVKIEAVNSFADELDRRARIRARHEREERRRERAYHRAMEGPPKPDLSSEYLFPPAPSLLSSPPLPDPPPMHEEVSPSTSATSPPGPSFAKMASSSGTWRVRKTVAPPPPPQPRSDEDEAGTPRTLSLSDAIEAALHAAPSSTRPAGKKHKKSKQKVLFATGMQRAA